MPNIEQTCYWLANRAQHSDTAALASMDSNINAEIAIVGGGFTGLWTAWFIKQLEPALDVALLEQGVVGYGASGRNAGMISNCIDHSHALAVAHFGLEEARKLAQIGLKNIQELTAFAQDCDLELTGQLQFALTPEHTEECAHNVKIATELGIQGYRFLSAEEARNEINSALYLGAVYIPGGGIIDPIKLVDRLKSSTAQLGVRFYERTKVLKIDGGKLQTDRGAVSAGKVILATDAYTHHLLPQLLWRYIPLYDYILVSDRLNADQLAAIGWRNRQGALDGKTFFNYYRLTADNRILWGSSEAMYYPPNRVDPSCDYSMRHFEDLRASFRRHFPPLADLAFPFAWGGPIASTTRLTPFFGACFGGRVIYGLGYTGHGIGSTRLAGKVLAHLALSRDSDLLKLKIVTNKPFPYPPEPLRALAVQAVTRSLRKKDNGQPANMLLKLLDALGIGFSS